MLTKEQLQEISNQYRMGFEELKKTKYFNKGKCLYYV